MEGFLLADDNAAVIRSIPTHGVEQESSVVSAPIMQWLAVDNVVRKLFDEARCQHVQRGWVFPVSQSMALQSTGHARPIQ